MATRIPFRGALPFVAALCAAFAVSACSDNSPTDNDDGTPITAEYYIQANINGKSVTHQQTALNTGQIGMAANNMVTGNGPRTAVIQEYSFNKATLGSNGFEVDTLADCPRITFIRNYDEYPYREDFDQLVSMSMNYGNEKTMADGVQISWTDGNGKRWSSSWGSGDQSGSKFTVTEHTKIEYQIGQPLGGRYKTKGTFNCNLYDNQGNSIAVKNGKFSMQTIYY